MINHSQRGGWWSLRTGWVATTRTKAKRPWTSSPAGGGRQGEGRPTPARGGGGGRRGGGGEGRLGGRRGGGGGGGEGPPSPGGGAARRAPAPTRACGRLGR